MKVGRWSLRWRADRFGRCQRGATAVEFSLVALPLIWVIGAILETGLYLTMQFELQNAVLDVSRRIRTGTLPASVTDASNFKTLVCGEVFMISNCAGNISIDVTSVRNADGKKFSDLSTVMKSPLAVGRTTAGGSYADVFNIGVANDPGAVIATYDWKFVFPLMSTFFSNVQGYSGVRRVYGIAVFKNETFS